MKLQLLVQLSLILLASTLFSGILALYAKTIHDTLTRGAKFSRDIIRAEEAIRQTLAKAQQPTFEQNQAKLLLRRKVIISHLLKDGSEPAINRYMELVNETRLLFHRLVIDIILKKGGPGWFTQIDQQHVKQYDIIISGILQDVIENPWRVLDKIRQTGKGSRVTELVALDGYYLEWLALVDSRVARGESTEERPTAWFTATELYFFQGRFDEALSTVELLISTDEQQIGSRSVDRSQSQMEEEAVPLRRFGIRRFTMKEFRLLSRKAMGGRGLNIRQRVVRSKAMLILLTKIEQSKLTPFWSWSSKLDAYISTKFYSFWGWFSRMKPRKEASREVETFAAVIENICLPSSFQDDFDISSFWTSKIKSLKPEDLADLNSRLDLIYRHLTSKPPIRTYSFNCDAFKVRFSDGQLLVSNP